MVVKEFLEDTKDGDDRNLALKIWKWIKYGIAGLALTVSSFGSCYRVPSDSSAIVQRFGKYVRQEGPGIHAKFPWIEKVTKDAVKQVQTEEFGYRTTKKGILGPEEVNKLTYEELEDIIRKSGKEPLGKDMLQMQAASIIRGEYLMLTGDLNMADVDWVVQYRIRDQKDYRFNVREPILALRDCSLSVMKQLTGNRSIDGVILRGIEEYAAAAKTQTQKLLDECETGIEIVAFKIQSSNAPRAVRDSFNKVSEAMAQKEQRVNEAMQAYNKEVPKAAGEAKGTIENAWGYYWENVNQAKGEVLAFDRLYAQYAQNPSITLTRMHYNALGDFFNKSASVQVVEQKGAEGGILLKMDAGRK